RVCPHCGHPPDDFVDEELPVTCPVSGRTAVERSQLVSGASGGFRRSFATSTGIAGPDDGLRELRRDFRAAVGAPRAGPPSAGVAGESATEPAAGGSGAAGE